MFKWLRKHLYRGVYYRTKIEGLDRRLGTALRRNRILTRMVADKVTMRVRQHAVTQELRRMANELADLGAAQEPDDVGFGLRQAAGSSSIGPSI